MIINLNKIKKFTVSETSIDPINIDGWVTADVIKCGVCRTDAKLWNEGHRDLELPRIVGHEMLVKYSSQRYVVWPGIICGECKYCKSGKTNLCDDIKIIGFHTDGGFSDKINIPKNCLVLINEKLDDISATFAEPAGCIINAFDKANLKSKENILIYGAGNVGLLMALMAKYYGAIPVIIESNQEKIYKAQKFIETTNIKIVKSTNQSKFDVVINATADTNALFNAITKADKGARVVHFSGLNKNENLESNLLNLIHYKEIIFSGSYGLTKENMEDAVSVLQNIKEYIPLIVERSIKPNEINNIIKRVIEARDYKYIINFNEHSENEIKVDSPQKYTITKTSEMNQKFNISQVNNDLKSKAQHKIDFKTKPLGSLGKLEDLAVKMSLIQNTLEPKINNKHLFVFAADHGIAEEGVSAFPQEVTVQMVQNFLNNGAAINVLSNHNNIKLNIVDAGVKEHSISDINLINIKVANGTQNFALQESMSINEAEEVIKNASDLFVSKNNNDRIDIVGLGEMGIANTTSATAIISAITGKSVANCTGRGTGVDDQGLEHKIKVIEKALRFHEIDGSNGLEVLSKVGGFEIAGMVGMALSAAENKTAVVLDGLISTAAGLIAYQINPNVANYFVSGHKSVEQGHIYALQHMGIDPILDLGFRLGEGTGAALTIGLVDSACKIMCEMASFEDAGVTNKEAE